MAENGPKTPESNPIWAYLTYRGPLVAFDMDGYQFVSVFKDPSKMTEIIRFFKVSTREFKVSTREIFEKLVLTCESTINCYSSLGQDLKDLHLDLDSTVISIYYCK